MTLKKIIKNILILIILIIIFIILNFYRSKKSIFNDIMILGLWNDIRAKNEYQLTSQKAIEIDVFTTVNTRRYKKIAPGSSGSFAIKFKKTINSKYIIKINEKTSKPANLIFILDGQKHSSIKEMEDIINEKFLKSEKITINWKWEYYINEVQDIQDTKDGLEVKKYMFEIEAIIEDEERVEI